MARPGHRVPGHILGLGYTCTCILLVKLIKRLQNIILPDALFLYVGQPIKTREESNIPYLSVFSRSVLHIRTRLGVTVKPETQWMPNSDSALELVTKCKILCQYDLLNYFYSCLKIAVF